MTIRFSFIRTEMNKVPGTTVTPAETSDRIGQENHGTLPDPTATKTASSTGRVTLAG